MSGFRHDAKEPVFGQSYDLLRQTALGKCVRPRHHEVRDPHQA